MEEVKLKKIYCTAKFPHIPHIWHPGPTWVATQCPGRKHWKRGSKPRLIKENQ